MCAQCVASDTTIKNKINTRITYGFYMLDLLVIWEEMQLQGCPVNLPCQGYPNLLLKHLTLGSGFENQIFQR